MEEKVKKQNELIQYVKEIVTDILNSVYFKDMQKSGCEPYFSAELLSEGDGELIERVETDNDVNTIIDFYEKHRNAILGGYDDERVETYLIFNQEEDELEDTEFEYLLNLSFDGCMNILDWEYYEEEFEEEKAEMAV